MFCALRKKIQVWNTYIIFRLAFWADLFFELLLGPPNPLMTNKMSPPLSNGRTSFESKGFWVVTFIKGALTRYGNLTWESAHAWNLIILCLLIA